MNIQPNHNPRVARLPKHARAQFLKQVSIYKAEMLKPPTRKQMQAWLEPIKRALREMTNGEVDSVRGYAVTKIHWADNDYARIDYCINGFTAMLDRLRIDGSVTEPLKRLSRKLANGVLLETGDINQSFSALNECENILLKFTRQQLKQVADTEMIAIEFDRMGIAGSNT